MYIYIHMKRLTCMHLLTSQFDPCICIPRGPHVLPLCFNPAGLQWCWSGRAQLRYGVRWTTVCSLVFPARCWELGFNAWNQVTPGISCTSSSSCCKHVKHLPIGICLGMHDDHCKNMWIHGFRAFWSRKGKGQSTVRLSHGFPTGPRGEVLNELWST